jgi:hypothetical protein
MHPNPKADNLSPFLGTVLYCILHHTYVKGS